MQIDDVSKENDYELYYHIQLYYEIFFRQAVNFTKYSYFIFFKTRLSYHVYILFVASFLSNQHSDYPKSSIFTIL